MQYRGVLLFLREDKMLETGIKGKMVITVDEGMTAKAQGSGRLMVYATPAMLALMEETAYRSVEDYLEEGQGTVGTKVSISHVSATPTGMKVTCESELVEIDRKRLVFSVKAFDERGLIGEGVHERFVIDNDKFLRRTQEKLEKEI